MRADFVLLTLVGLASTYVEERREPETDQQALNNVQIFEFSDQFQIFIQLGTPAQKLRVRLSIEDDSTYVFSESCAYSNLCNQNKSLNYFQESHSSTFFTEHKTFDGSVLSRPGPTGIVGRDIITFAGQAFAHDFGIVDRSWFESKGDGVIGLGINPDYDLFQQSYIFHLLQRFERKQVGILVLPNHNLSVPNKGILSIGGKLPTGCYRDESYDYTALQYPGKQWTFTLQSAMYDFITPTMSHYSATVRPGQFYTIGPDVFLDAFFDYIQVVRLDSLSDNYYIQQDNTLALPDLQFYTGGNYLTLRPEDYLSKRTSYGQMVLLKKRPPNYSGLKADWVFGDNFLQRYCVLLEYAMVDSKIGFAFAYSNQHLLSMVILLACNSFVILSDNLK